MIPCLLQGFKSNRVSKFEAYLHAEICSILANTHLLRLELDLNYVPNCLSVMIIFFPHLDRGKEVKWKLDSILMEIVSGQI